MYILSCDRLSGHLQLEIELGTQAARNDGLGGAFGRRVLLWRRLAARSALSPTWRRNAATRPYTSAGRSSGAGRMPTAAAASVGTGVTSGGRSHVLSRHGFCGQQLGAHNRQPSQEKLSRQYLLTNHLHMHVV